MSETQSKKISWPRMGVEAIIIIASILLALGVDEWREDRRDRMLEREYLGQLLDDFEVNITEAKKQRFAHALQVANARAVYPRVHRGVELALEDAIIVTASYNASPSATANWVDDTFEELKSTGRLSLIRSPEIRHTLLAYYRFLDTQD